MHTLADANFGVAELTVFTLLTWLVLTTSNGYESHALYRKTRYALAAANGALSVLLLGLLVSAALHASPATKTSNEIRLAWLLAAVHIANVIYMIHVARRTWLVNLPPARLQMRHRNHRLAQQKEYYFN